MSSPGATFTHVADQPDVGILNAMSWQEFEGLVGEAFRRRGYQVEETGGQGAVTSASFRKRSFSNLGTVWARNGHGRDDGEPAQVAPN